jgi:hypothetical protein
MTSGKSELNEKLFLRSGKNKILVRKRDSIYQGVVFSLPMQFFILKMYNKY